MLLQINRKIFIYLFIFFILATYTNKQSPNFGFPRISNYNVTGLSEIKNIQISKDLSALQNQSLFFLKKKKISKVINSHKMIEKFYIFKNYPSNLNVIIEKTNYLALTKKNGVNFFIASNGNLIKAKDYNKDLPVVKGNFKILEFLELKKIIDNSNFNYKKIKNLYYFKSNRWNIETKDNQIIKLPTTNLNMSFELLLNIYENKELKDFKIIDLRQGNLVIFDE